MEADAFDFFFDLSEAIRVTAETLITISSNEAMDL
jgi:hypothetical protein